MGIHLQLMLTFMRIGLFTFGGGYAMLALIEDICVEEKRWITHDEMMNVTVVAESTPGPIAINCATFVGHKQAGLSGALAATLGIVLPSFAIIYAISLCLAPFMEIPLIANAFRGIRLAVGLLILHAGMNMLKKMPKKRLPRTIMACACAAMVLILFLNLPVSSITLMLLCGAVSMLLFAFGGKKGKGGERA